VGEVAVGLTVGALSTHNVQSAVPMLIFSIKVLIRLGDHLLFPRLETGTSEQQV